jgi:hypothetical protein
MSDTAEVESDTTADSSSSRESSPLGTKKPALQLYYDQIVDFLDKLFDLSAMIKRSSRNSRESRAAGYVEKDDGGNDILLEFKAMTRLKIRGLWPRTDDWLIERLVDVIAKRRQQFLYQRRHERRRWERPTLTFDNPPATVVTQLQSIDLTTKPSNEKYQAPQQPLELSKQHDVSMHAPAASQAPTVTQSSTASHLSRKQSQILEQEVRATPTELRIKESVFPDLPPKGEHDTFQCTQCFQILPEKMRTNESWR